MVEEKNVTLDDLGDVGAVLEIYVALASALISIAIGDLGREGDCEWCPTSDTGKRNEASNQ